ncbi:TlpA family protein disulfide reductase [Corynebacterium caspium]|uniref:TlpA family protein disulfide reductase n=1 Tax=Corynebacterium caspium TaxID=234828 RepID=UPI000362FA29|nr:TlpA disulfide reductase family protein [Corynebacterium caspium]WKD58566.1 Thioredoxin [Corynebacterium caspium DSM 44850]
MQNTSAKKIALISILVIAALTAIMIAVLPQALKKPTAAVESASPVISADNADNAAVLALRPDCPAVSLPLDCLGGQVQAGQGTDTRPLLVNMWAWWCAPCQEELPVLEEFAAAHPQYQVVGVHADKEAGAGAQILTDLKVGLPSFADPKHKMAGIYQLPNVLPVSLLLDPTRLDAQGNPQLIKLFVQSFSSVEQLSTAVSEAIANA